MIPEHGSVIVSWDYTNGKDKAIAVIGKKAPGQAIKVINAYEGDEAIALIKKLVEKEGRNNGK